MTTSAPALAQRIAEEAERRGLHAMDAPVSGGDVGAREGRLVIMCGGREEDFTALQPVLRAEGLNVVSGEFCHLLEVFQPSATMIADGALGKVRPGSIIIFHDGYDGRGGNRASTVEAVRIVVDRLLSDGYGFTTVDRILGLPAYQD